MRHIPSEFTFIAAFHSKSRRGAGRIDKERRSCYRWATRIRDKHPVRPQARPGGPPVSRNDSKPREKFFSAPSPYVANAPKRPGASFVRQAPMASLYPFRPPASKNHRAPRRNPRRMTRRSKSPHSRAEGLQAGPLAPAAQYPPGWRTPNQPPCVMRFNAPFPSLRFVQAPAPSFRAQRKPSKP